MGKLLVVADQGDGCVATSRGLELAHKLGHSTEIVAFTYAPLTRIAPSKTQQDTIKQQLLDRRREEAEARIASLAKEGQKVSLKVVWLKDIHPWVIKRAAAGKFDAVIKTSHASGSMTYTSTDWHLLRDCEVPVLIAAENKWHRTKPILAALDLGTKSRAKQKLNDRVLSHARALADALKVELKIISAIEVPTLLADLDIVDPESYAKELKQTMEPRIRKLAAAHDVPEASFVCKRGPVAKVITSQAAKTRAQLVVLGTVGRGGLKAKLIGNTAEDVLRHLRTDILAIKPEGK
jgi:universal stress protein E